MERGGGLEGGDVRVLWDHEPWTSVSAGDHLHPLCQQYAQLEGIWLHTGTNI